MFWKKRRDSPVSVTKGGFSLGAGSAAQTPDTGTEPVQNSDRLLSEGIRSSVGSAGASIGGRPSREAAFARVGYILPRGYRISGNIVVSGPVRIDGELTGKGLVANSIHISSTGVLRAPAEADQIVVEGVVDAPVRGRELIEVRAGAEVRSDVESPSLRLDPRAVLVGSRCQIGSRAELESRFAANADR